MYVDDMN